MAERGVTSYGREQQGTSSAADHLLPPERHPELQVLDVPRSVVLRLPDWVRELARRARERESGHVPAGIIRRYFDPEFKKSHGRCLELAEEQRHAEARQCFEELLSTAAELPADPARRQARLAGIRHMPQRVRPEADVTRRALLA